MKRRIARVTPFAKAVQQCRQSMGWTQERLAEEAGVSKRTIEKCEAGDAITLSTLDKIARSLATTTDRLSLEPTRVPLGQTYFRQKITREKILVAKAAAHLIKVGDSVAASSGTTVALVIDELCNADKHVQIFTNNIGVIDLAGDRAESILLAGGRFVRSIHATAGPDAVAFFRNIRFRCALLGVSAVTKDGDLYILNPEDSDVYGAILSEAVSTIIVAAEASKLARSDAKLIANLHKLPPKREIILVTNPPAVIVSDEERSKAEDTINALKQQHIKVVEAEEG